MARERIAGVIAVAVFLALLGIRGLPVLQSCGSYRPVSSGEVAPDFELPTITDRGLGPRRTLSELRGRIVLVDFWATWCGPCRTTMPKLGDIASRYDDVELLSVNTEGPDAIPVAHDMIGRLAPEAISVIDTAGVSRRYRVTTIPHLVVVDRDGSVAMVKRGSSSAGLADVAALVDRLATN